MKKEENEEKIDEKLAKRQWITRNEDGRMMMIGQIVGRSDGGCDYERCRERGGEKIRSDRISNRKLEGKEEEIRKRGQK